MQSLILFRPDQKPFNAQMVERAFRSCGKFSNLRFNEPGGALIECEYNEPEDYTIIRLASNSATIAISHTWGAALRAAILVQNALQMPLRMVDDDYSFDLTFDRLSTAEELEAAIDNARTA